MIYRPTQKTHKRAIPAVCLVLFAFAAGAGVVGTPRGALATQMDMTEVAKHQTTPPSITQAYARLASEADSQFAELSMIVDWAKEQASEPLKKRVYELSFRLDDELVTPVSTVVTDAWERERVGDAYSGYSDGEFWQIYDTLVTKERSFRAAIMDLQQSVYQAQGVKISDASIHINTFKEHPIQSNP